MDRSKAGEQRAIAVAHAHRGDDRVRAEHIRPAIAEPVACAPRAHIRDQRTPGRNIPDRPIGVLQMIVIQPPANAHAVERQLRVALKGRAGAHMAHAVGDPRIGKPLERAHIAVIFRPQQLAAPIQIGEMGEHAGNLDNVRRVPELADHRVQLRPRGAAQPVQAAVDLDMDAKVQTARAKQLCRARDKAGLRHGQQNIVPGRRNDLRVARRRADDEDVRAHARLAQPHRLRHLRYRERLHAARAEHRLRDRNEPEAVCIALEHRQERRACRKLLPDSLHVRLNILNIYE